MAKCHRSLSHPHDPDLSRMLVVYVPTGIAFMLFPGTFVGVLNLMKIAGAHAQGAADASWVQAHGHAQLFGWLGTFILGVGYYTIPRLRRSRFSHAAAWSTWVLWTTGVAIRWSIGTWALPWRVLLPLSGCLELIAVTIFAVSVYLAKPRVRDDAWRTSVLMITAAGASMVIAVAVNAIESFAVAMTERTPAFPTAFNQRYLVLVTWGFVVPFVWGFSSRWLPPLLGLRKTHTRLAIVALITLFIGTALSLAIVLLVATIAFVIALRLFERPERKPKLSPGFIRIAYAWPVAAIVPMPNGFAGASRHALTVRVVAQILAYQHLSERAWSALGVSAAIEMTAVTLFAANMMLTLTTGSPLESVIGVKSETLDHKLADGNDFTG